MSTVRSIQSINRAELETIDTEERSRSTSGPRSGELIKRNKQKKSRALQPIGRRTSKKKRRLQDKKRVRNEDLDELTPHQEVVISNVTELENHIGNDQVTDQVTNQATDQVTNQVTNQVTDQVADQVTDQATDQVADQVTHSITEIPSVRLGKDNTLQVDDSIISRKAASFGGNGIHGGLGKYGGRHSKTKEEIEHRKLERVRRTKARALKKLMDKVEATGNDQPQDWSNPVFEVHPERYVDVAMPESVIFEVDDIFNLQTNELHYHKLKAHLFKEGRVSHEAMVWIIERATAIVERESNILDIPRLPETHLVGDIHGQFYDMLKLFDSFGDDIPQNYLFLGDYVDRGYFSCEVCILLFCLKIAYPENIWMIRGNHETRLISRSFGFFYEVKKKFTIPIYEQFMKLFDSLPIAAIVTNNMGRFFCCHGGLSKYFSTTQDLEQIHRFHEPLEEGSALMDILWSDPNDKTPEIDFQTNIERRCSVVFGYNPVKEFLETNNFVSIIRAHQLKSEGYEAKYYTEFTDTDIPLVITIFSAPNYCGTHHNKAACLRITEEDFEFIQTESQEAPYVDRDFKNAIELTLPLILSSVNDIFEYTWEKMKLILAEDF